MKDIEAVTFDFFKTLARPSGGKTRGEAYIDYLAAADLPHAPWEHRMLYDIFEYYREAYHPGLPAERKARFWQVFAKRLFAITGVPLTREEDIAAHCPAIVKIFSSSFLVLFNDARGTLDRLLAGGLKLAVLSNWPGGLDHYCEELGLGGYFRFCLASSDFGRAKPDPSIFLEAARRLGCAPAAVVHVGDTMVEDIEGALLAGLRPVLLDRDGRVKDGNIRIIRSLDQLVTLIFPDEYK
jgi:FMN phosphatase YigB (HAD superfamily)